MILLFVLELGFIPKGSLDLYDMEIEPTNYVEMKVGFEVGALYALGWVNTMMDKAEGIWFSPHTSVYGVEGGFEFWKLRVGYRHLCTHPIVPWYDPSRGTIVGDGSADILFVRYER